jgi:hypothetical protein
MIRVSGVPYEVELPIKPEQSLTAETIRHYVLKERKACLEIAEIPGMTPADIARVIRSRGGV